MIWGKNFYVSALTCIIATCHYIPGGMDHHLYTPCGSAAYAAPELVSGKEYLGDMVSNLFFEYIYNLWELSNC